MAKAFKGAKASKVTKTTKAQISRHPKSAKASKPSAAKPDKPKTRFGRIPYLVHRNPEGSYWAEVPSLPGCYTQADTMAELRDNIQEAIDLHLDERAAPAKKPRPRKAAQ